MKRIALLIVLLPLLAVAGLAEQSVYLYPGVTFTGPVTLVNAATLGWSDAFFCRGAASVIGLGGCTSSFPALKRNATTMQFRLGDDSGYTAIQAGGFATPTTTLIHSTAPTISSGFGTSPSIANNNGTAAFTVNVGTGGTASSGTIGLTAAANGWVCSAFDFTSPTTGGGYYVKQTGGTTTTAVLTGFNTAGAATAWSASDVLRVSCFAY